MHKMGLITVLGFGLDLASMGDTLAANAPAIPAGKPHVDVVFVLDTTGSMSGLIAAAKEKIWAIANTLTKTQPAPQIRMGLIGYRDRGDEYVTRVTDLTENLDAVYESLLAFSADGGGDEPESVNQALHEALTRMSWRADNATYKAIFLVGDAPPHMDYQNDVKYPESLKLANQRGIVVNAIQCGASPNTTPIWREIALRTEGSFFEVAPSGNAVAVTTPYDADLARLSADMEATRIPYGSIAERDRQTQKFALSSKVHAAAP